jgi:UTP--glucose-1-phosphate uridylyltransferase
MQATVQIKTAVITAAGFGTRFLPVSKAVPKEMLALVDKPVIQYAVDQAVEAGIERIILITSEGKEAMESYFHILPKLEQALQARKSPKLEEVQRVSRMAEIIPVTQELPLGLGHAVLCAKEAVGDEPFIVYLPDEILLGEPSATRQMVDSFARLGTSVIGVKQVPAEDVGRYGVVAGDPVSDNELRLARTVEKPKPEEAPSDLAIFGPYVFTPDIFECLENITPGAGGELQLTDAIDMLAQRQPVHACRLNVHRYDAGTPLGLLETAVELALQRPDYADQVKAWIKDLAQRLD